jgi:Alpha/beta hydrolase domain
MDGEHRGSLDGDIHESPLGYSRPFSAAELHHPYPDREAYLGRWNAALDAGIADGFILPEDASAMKAAAETANTILPQ